MERCNGSKIVAVVPNQVRKSLLFDTGLMQVLQEAEGDQIIEVSGVEAQVGKSEWLEEVMKASERLRENFEGLQKGMVVVLDSFSAMSPMHKMMQDIELNELIHYEEPVTDAERERARQKERKEFHKFVNSRRGRGKRR